jgi:C-terminal processing protease CtpA/Prc
MKRIDFRRLPQFLVMWHCLFTLSAFFVHSRSIAQESSSDQNALQAERDRWTSSSLGLEFQPTKSGLRITKVILPSSLTPFRKSDLLTFIERLPSSSTADSSHAENRSNTDDSRPRQEVLNGKKLKRLLESCEPHSMLKATIVRDNQHVEIEAKTVPPEWIDACQIAVLIRDNKAIQQHLAESSQTLEDLESTLIAAVTKSPSPRLAQESINQVLDSLNISHTAYVPKLVYQQLTGHHIGDLGIVLRRFQLDNQDPGYFVIDIKPGSPASQGTLRLGDKITKVNGLELDQSRRLLLAGEENRYSVYSISASVNDTVQLELFRSNSQEPISLSLASKESLSLGDTTTSSVRVIEQAGRLIGYVRFWSFMSEDVVGAFRSSLKSQLAPCEALVVDLRGRGGRVDVLTQIDELIQAQKVPVVVIIDELSRSAKEILAHRLKQNPNIILVGEKTAGAVTPASFVQLASGNLLMQPASHGDSLKNLTNDCRLEGIGVEPSYSVNFFEPYCNGRDKLTEFAIRKVLSRLWQ